MPANNNKKKKRKTNNQSSAATKMKTVMKRFQVKNLNANKCNYVCPLCKPEHSLMTN